jgi:hypothetical protein
MSFIAECSAFIIILVTRALHILARRSALDATEIKPRVSAPSFKLISESWDAIESLR